MQDLLEKIEELRKALATMKPKKDTLVPALSIPPVKPLSISAPSGGSAKSAKLPGVAPVSGKDPKKMAEQLKNPRPKAPKIEVLKTDKNGQWSLEKGSMRRLAPMTPKDAVGYGIDVPFVQDWTIRGDRDARENMPKLTGPARTRGLHKLSSLTESRVNPETKEREFLLHRGTSMDEINAHKGGEIPIKTSWTPYVDQAKAFGENNLGTTMSAWIPEKHIHHIPNAIGHDVKTGSGVKPEHEVVVAPHKLNLQPQQVKKFGEGNSV